MKKDITDETAKTYFDGKTKEEEIESITDETAQPQFSDGTFNSDAERDALYAQRQKAVEKFEAEKAAKAASAEAAKSSAESAAKKAADTKAHIDRNQRAGAASASAQMNQTDAGDSVAYDAAGNETFRKTAEGKIVTNPNNAAAKSLVRDEDGNLRWENGKLAGRRPTPNGNEAATKQAAMDKNTDALLAKLRQNNPNHYSDETLLMNYAQQHNAPIEKARAKANPPKPRNGGVVVGGGDPHARFQERRRDFVAGNPNAVSPSERAKVLGSGGAQTFDQAAQQQRAAVNQQQLNMLNQSRAAHKKAQNDKAMQQAGRRIAMGNAISQLLGDLNDPYRGPGDSRIYPPNDPKASKHYLRVNLDDEGIANLNAEHRKAGGTSDYKNVMVQVEIDSNGRPKEGVKPTIFYRWSDDGQDGAGQLKMKSMSIDHIAPLLRDSLMLQGNSREGAEDLVYDAMGGYSVIGRDAAMNRELEAKKANNPQEVANTRAGYSVLINEQRDLRKELKDWNDNIVAKSQDEAAWDAHRKELEAKLEASYAKLEVMNGGAAGSNPSSVGDNSMDDNAPSSEYPGYSNGKAKRALAAGYVWNKDKKIFEPKGQ